MIVPQQVLCDENVRTAEDDRRHGGQIGRQKGGRDDHQQAQHQPDDALDLVIGAADDHVILDDVVDGVGVNLDAREIPAHRSVEAVAFAARGHPDQDHLALQVRGGDAVVEDVGEGNMRKGIFGAAEVHQHLAMLVDGKCHRSVRALDGDFLVAQGAEVEEQGRVAGQGFEHRERERDAIAVMEARNHHDRAHHPVVNGIDRHDTGAVRGLIENRKGRPIPFGAVQLTYHSGRNLRQIVGERRGQDHLGSEALLDFALDAPIGIQ